MIELSECEGILILDLKFSVLFTYDFPYPCDFLSSGIPTANKIDILDLSPVSFLFHMVSILEASSLGLEIFLLLDLAEH